AQRRHFTGHRDRFFLGADGPHDMVVAAEILWSDPAAEPYRDTQPVQLTLVETQQSGPSGTLWRRTRHGEGTADPLVLVEDGHLDGPALRRGECALQSGGAGSDHRECAASVSWCRQRPGFTGTQTHALIREVRIDGEDGRRVEAAAVLVTGNTRPDLVRAALDQLVHDVGVRDVGPSHSHQVRGTFGQRS